jgi:hypothetical protein
MSEEGLDDSLFSLFNLSPNLLGTGKWGVLSKVLDKEETSEPLNISSIWREYKRAALPRYNK